ncbi:hypothetical protein GCM10018779_58720 [Streptomyces griseocarneus]|nr:hypothetical protein GCM10018779_58720 [Streptomyces griseocarneus]
MRWIAPGCRVQQGVERSIRWGVSPWIVSDELWDRLEPPQRERRLRYPGRRLLPDREVLCGILYVLHTGIQWEYRPKGLGFGSGMTCWRRLRGWARRRPAGAGPGRLETPPHHRRARHPTRGPADRRQSQ